MKRLAIVAALLLTIYSGWRVSLLYFDIRPEQDECTFGEISIQSYKALLAEARRRSKSVWPRLGGSDLDIADNLRLRIRDLNSGQDSIAARIAGMHAVMRDAGAFLHGMKDYSKLPLKINGDPELQLEGTAGLSFPYFIDSLKIGHVDLVDPYARLTIELPFMSPLFYRGRNDVKRPIESDEFYATISLPDSLGRVLRLGKGWVGYDADAKGSPCPSMPPPDWVDVYEHWKINQKSRNAK